ncbi:hypothetical protein MYX07_06030 [Patescibacteria group bacterium AH-259-L07]|nr:hypothetical protein [Patescibacteria group bacterium AH-259-L07]
MNPEKTNFKKPESSEPPPQQHDKKQKRTSLYELPEVFLSLDELKKALKPFLEMEAKNRNFDIEIKKESKTCSIILRKEDGSQRDLSEFLPKGFKFEPAEEYSVKISKKRVQFNPREINQRAFLLSLGHELGHAGQEKINKIHLTKQRIRRLREISKTLIKLLREAKKISQKTKGLSKAGREKFLEELEAKMNEKSGESPPPMQLLEKREKHTAQSERTAWAEGLRILRKLSRDGYDVLNGFNTREEIKAYIAYYLYTYELKNISKKLAATTSDTIEIQHKLKVAKPDDVITLLRTLRSISESKEERTRLTEDEESV